MSRKHHASRSVPSSHRAQLHRGVRQRNLTPWWIGLAVLIVLGAAFLILRPQGTLPSEVQVAQAYDMYQKGAVFLDVRTQEEWNQGHIARSLLIPLDQLQQRLNELPRDKDIVVVCKLGSRSKEGAAVLRQAGFARATCMSGGIQAWVAAGYPIEE